MNAHIRTTTAEPYRFEIGQAVDHIAGNLHSIVVDRETTLMGRQLYHLAVRHGLCACRIVRGDFLVAA